MLKSSTRLLMAAFLLSSASFADTYNFTFPEKSEPEASQAPAPVSTPASQSLEVAPAPVAEAQIRKQWLFGLSGAIHSDAFFIVGYRFTPAFGMNVYLPTPNVDIARLYSVLDFEWYPARINAGNYDVLEVGLFAGLVGVGARANLNIGNSLTLTAAYRYASKGNQFEVGGGIHF